MYVKYCENKPKSEFIVAEYIDTVFSVSVSHLLVAKCVYGIIYVIFLLDSMVDGMFFLNKLVTRQRSWRFKTFTCNQGVET